jgi:hypothetical protein
LVGLNHQVDVIVLDREFDDPHPEAIVRLQERLLNLEEDELISQTADVTTDAQSDVLWMARGKLRTRLA